MVVGEPATSPVGMQAVEVSCALGSGLDAALAQQPLDARQVPRDATDFGVPVRKCKRKHERGQTGDKHATAMVALKSDSVTAQVET